MQRELKLELPNYIGREEDVKTINIIADKYDLGYDAYDSPIIKVTDMVTKEVVLSADQLKRIYITGEEDKVEAFLNDLREWFTKF